MNDFPAVLGSYFEGLKAHDVNKISLAVADDLAFVTPARTLTKQQFLGLLRALYTGFPDWHYEHGGPEIQQDEIAVLFRQGGYHTGPFGPPGSLPVKPTGRYVAIPEHYFFYKLRDNQITQIRPEPVAGGAPVGIYEQLGMKWTAS